MKIAHVLVLSILVAFASGTGLGYMISAAPAASVAKPVALHEEAKDEGKPGPTAQRSELNTPKHSPAEPKAAPASEKVGVSLREVIASYPVETPSGGTGMIKGTVKHTNGSPMPGVEVTAMGSLNAFARGKGNQQAEIEDEVAALIKRRKFALATKVSTTTDAEGKYVLEGLSDIDYYPYGVKAGFRISGSGGAVRPPQTCDLVASPYISLIVEVLGPDGLPHRNAEVNYVMSSGRTSGRRNTDEYPRAIELEPGTWTISASDPNAPEFRSDPVTVEAAEGIELPPLVLRLSPGNCIKGKVLWEAGQTGQTSLHYLSVSLSPYEEKPGSTDTPESRVRRRARSGGIQNYSRESGNFAFVDVKPGKYELAAYLDGRVIASAIVDYVSGTVEQDLTIPAPKRADHVVVWAYGPDGKLLADLSFSVAYREKGSSSSRGTTATRQPDGSYWVAHHPDERVKNPADGKYFVSARSEKYGEKEVEYPKTETSEVTINFCVPASLKVTVLDFTNCTFKDQLHVDLNQAGQGMSSSYRGFDESDSSKPHTGTWEFKAREPQKYNIALSLRYGDSPWDMRLLSSQEITLQSGENTASIVIPALYSLKVRTGEAKADVRITLRNSDQNARWQVEKNTDINGEVVFDGNPAGSYEVRLGRDRMTVSLPESSDILFVATVFNALKVTITDDKSYAATSGLLSGDLIISANGIEFKTERQMSSTIESLAEETSVKLGVLRNGASMEITLDLSKLFKTRGGFDIKPATR